MDGENANRIGVAILGSTGSVGRQVLDVIDALPDRFRVVALAARGRSPLFQQQVSRYRPEVAAVADQEGPDLIGAGALVTSTEGLVAAATHPEVDIVVVATSGHDAISPTIRAIELGKTIALANKETLVCAGEIIMPLAAASKTVIRPVDSEHSAIWQAIGTSSPDEISRLLLTASGGPFRTMSMAEMAGVTARQALAHPTWSMGGKITVDSATLMNKGLEVIEAHWLFGMPYDKIDVVVHPDSVVHSIVEFVDGSQIAQLGLPDMRVPIQYALTYPERLPRQGKRLDLATIGALRFEQPDEDRFPALRLARQAGLAGGTYPTVLSAADDEAVAAFLEDVIAFTDVAGIVSDVLDRHTPSGPLTLDAICAADQWARGTARDIIDSLPRS
ncbi:MAG: 1-deoxy-D-xylulose-5-phosphate reductoisomerase [Thermomicrobiales bacterium]|nr:1-deoxy-D-xylulose-5-phosphate reductoisomerase [Thermomicrobiales bacterium]